MPKRTQSAERSDLRAYWAGIPAQAVLSIERNPFDRQRAFAVPDEIVGSSDAPAVRVFAAIAASLEPHAHLHALSDAPDDMLDPDVDGELPPVRDVQHIALAAGLLERRRAHARLTARAEKLLLESGGLDRVLPQLIKGWARQAHDARLTRFEKALHGTWPLLVLLLHRFGERWMPVGFYAQLVADMAPQALRATGERDAEDAFDAFGRSLALDLVLRFVAFFGLVEVWLDEADENAELELRATPLLEAVFPLPCDQEPASAVLSDWESPPDNPAALVNRELSAALSEQSFESEGELQEFVAAFMQRRNATPLDAFDGISADQMHHLLERPFEIGGPLIVADVPRSAPRCAMLHLVLDLANALGDEGLRATAKGNLPRVFVKGAVERYRAAGLEDDRLSGLDYVHNEGDFFDLHVARVVARWAGLVKLHRGRWSLTQAYHRTLERDGEAGIYARLFEAFVNRYNWAFGDRYSESRIVQSSWAYSLLLLARYGGTWRTSTFYVDRFVQAFPMLLDEILADESVFSSGREREPEETVRHIFETRVLQRFAKFFGLVEIARSPGLDGYLKPVRVRATAALADVVAEATAPAGTQ